MTSVQTLSPVYSIVNVDSQSNPAALIDTLISSGAGILQIRWKEHSVDSISELIRYALNLSKQNSNSTSIIVNDSVELSQATGAHGVHLGQTDCSPKRARALLGPTAIIGHSTHSLEQIKNSPIEVLNYLALGPIFLSPTKSGHAEPVGLDTLRTACRISPLPIVAIGGINEENVRSVYQAGASSVALISALENAKNTPELIKNLNSQFLSSQSGSKKHFLRSF